MKKRDKILRSILLKSSREKLREIKECRSKPIECQQYVFEHFIHCAKESKFGKEKGLDKVRNVKEFQSKVPIYNYNSFAPYIERVRNGENYLLWNQKVKWFARSSGTSSQQSKYIPITPDSLKFTHYGGMKMMLLNYIEQNENTQIPTTKALTLGGSIVCTHEKLRGGEIYSGDLSAIMIKHSPKIAEYVRVPKREVALLGDFDKKVELIAKSASKWNVSNFSGVPSWNLVMLNRILEKSRKSNLFEIWPNLEVFFHGGTNFLPYIEPYKRVIPSSDMYYVENYNASEGYFAFQDEIDLQSNDKQKEMLICTNNGIFYEFIPFQHLDSALEGDNSQVVTLEGVKTGIDYAIIISTYGGLYRYMPEDLVRFTSVNPYKLVVCGRTKLYINAFGEELMTENAERAINSACKRYNAEITEFTVAPEFMDFSEDGQFKKGRHIWAIEFKTKELQKGSSSFNPELLNRFTSTLDMELSQVNSDYEAKRSNSSTLQELKIESLREGTFYKWMEKRGKLGGQNKVPRLWRDKTYLEQLLNIDNNIDDRD